MKRQLVINIFCRSGQSERVQGLCDRVGIVDGASCSLASKYGDWFLRIAHDDERAAVLLSELAKEEPSPGVSVREEVLYSKSEILAAEWLVLWITRQERGESGLTYGTAYDDAAACPVCGSGARQRGALRVASSAVPTKSLVAQTLAQEVLIAEALRSRLMDAHDISRDVRPVEDKGGTPIPGWWQLYPAAYFPRWSEESSGMRQEEPCGRCGRDGFGQILSRPLEIAFRRDAVDSMAGVGVAFSWEHFGRSKRSSMGDIARLAMPLILVHQTIARVLIETKVAGLKLIPVRVL